MHAKKAKMTNGKKVKHANTSYTTNYEQTIKNGKKKKRGNFFYLS